MMEKSLIKKEIEIDVFPMTIFFFESNLIKMGRLCSLFRVSVYIVNIITRHEGLPASKGLDAKHNNNKMGVLSVAFLPYHLFPERTVAIFYY